MKNGPLIAFFILFLACKSESYAAERTIFRQQQEFLAEFVKDNKVNYAELVRDPQSLRNLLENIATADLKKFDEDELKTFYINTYNLLVIAEIVDHFPVKSPYEIEGFFDETHFKVAGEMLTLNELEEKKLLYPYRDFRLVFALCSGTLGSFPLSDEAFRPDKLHKQLNSRVKTLVNDVNFVRIKKNSSRILICESFIPCSRISGAKEIIENLNELREEEVPDSFSIDYYPSNRQLNAAED